jgi:hypothetical protein
MSTAASAVTTVDPAPTTPTVDIPREWTPAELADWNKTGAIPKLPSSQDSAPAKKDAVADPAPQKKEKDPAVSASDSATDKDTQKPHKKPEDYGERRFQELANENKTLKQRLEALERRGTEPEKRDTKQASQPAPEEYKPLDIIEWQKANPDKKYEDFVRASARHEAQWEVRQQVAQAIANERQRIQVEALQQSMGKQLEEMQARYPELDVKKLDDAAGELLAQDVPLIVKHMVGGSKVFGDLMYVLTSDPKFSELVALAKRDPVQAMRRIAVIEAQVEEMLKGKSAAPKGDGKSNGGTQPRAEDGKFQSSEKKDGASDEPRPRAPKPPAEVGGRGAAAEDAAVAAARSGSFGDFDEEMKRRYRA